MKQYKIIISVSDVGGTYSANSIQEAEEIAQAICDDIYARLRGRCSAEVESVEEINSNEEHPFENCCSCGRKLDSEMLDNYNITIDK